MCIIVCITILYDTLGVTTLIVCLLFVNHQMIPSTVCIKEEFGSRTEFPNESGKFNFAGFHDGTSFEVMGDENSSHSRGSLFSSSSTTTLASRPWAQNAAAVATTSSSSFTSCSFKGNTKPKATVKVVFAGIGPNGKPVVDISQPKQTFVPIQKEGDANVKYILSIVETNFNDSNLELVGNNGFRYNDEPGTRGTLSNLNYYVFVLSIMIG